MLFNPLGAKDIPTRTGELGRTPVVVTKTAAKGVKTKPPVTRKPPRRT
jgi:hypothetical protein